MRKIIIAAAALLIAAPAYAQTVQSGSQSGAYSQSGVTFGSNPKQAPNAIAPGLIASGLSCSGSASVGGAGAGWGVSFGFTKADEHCDAREDAKILAALAGNTAALARMCQIKKNAQALADAGITCPGNTIRAAASAPALRSSQPAVTTPPTTRVVRMKMSECLKLAKSNPNVTCRAVN